ncbi:MAG: acyl-CoA dehydrogenase, partial [Rhodocyclaceae bacterium]|nr:acyl-CoA dehydrogenase [Rhodocyclaceae bacterium]
MAREALDWPFLDDEHRGLAAAAEAWCRAELGHVDHDDADAVCRSLVKRLGAAGWLQHCVPGEKSVFSARRICLMRETLAYHDGLAEPNSE